LALMSANLFNSRICNGLKRNVPMPKIIKAGQVVQFHHNAAGVLLPYIQNVAKETKAWR
jgi:hypothetical protein